MSGERYDVVVVGGGTAGCVVAARLTESPGRSVCLLEAGPDHGPPDSGRWPDDLLDPRFLPGSHDWGVGGEDERTLGARVIGGSSSHNACMVVAGSPADYDEWGHGWSWNTIRPYLLRASAALRTAPANTAEPAPYHEAFIASAQANGFALLRDLNDTVTPVGVARIPCNVVDGLRWNASFAYLDPARVRPDLTVVSDALVDRVVIDGGASTGVVLADGRRIGADLVVLTAGAYFTSAILLRSGVGPDDHLRALGIEQVASLPVGETLLDHCGTGIAWAPSEQLVHETRAHEAATGRIFEPHAVVKAASTRCAPGSWDLHLLSWLYKRETGEGYDATIGVFHLKPSPAGKVRLASTDPRELPAVQRGFLAGDGDLEAIVDGLALARRLAATEPFASSLGEELRPGAADLAEYVRDGVRNYYHPAGTCPLGAVVDGAGRVRGIAGLVVADASIMPTIPRANTNLTTAAIAERIAERLA